VGEREREREILSWNDNKEKKKRRREERGGKGTELASSVLAEGRWTGKNHCENERKEKEIKREVKNRGRSKADTANHRRENSVGYDLNQISDLWHKSIWDSF